MNKKVTILLILLIALYLIVNFATPTNPAVLARYKMDAMQYQLMRASFAVPLIFVWTAAFYGFSKIINYARMIKKSPDGEGFMWIAVGLTTLGVGMLANSIMTTMLSRAVVLDILSQPASTIITTHLSVAYQLASFLFIALGSWKLLTILKKSEFPRLSLIIGSGILSFISVFYIIAALSNPSREVPVPPAQTAAYYMNDFLIVLTIILPYIFSWACGIFAVIAIRTYQKHVGGILYKKALKKFNTGLLIIIIMAIIVQFTTAAVTTTYGWALGPYVLIAQLFVFAIGVGFALVALGAKGLAKLEEVS